MGATYSLAVVSVIFLVWSVFKGDMPGVLMALACLTFSVTLLKFGKQRGWW